MTSRKVLFTIKMPEHLKHGPRHIPLHQRPNYPVSETYRGYPRPPTPMPPRGRSGDLEDDEPSPVEDVEDRIATTVTIPQHLQQRPRFPHPQHHPNYRASKTYSAYPRPPTPMPPRFRDDEPSDDNDGDKSEEGPIEDSNSSTSSSNNDENDDDKEGLTFRETVHRMHQTIDAALAAVTQWYKAHRDMMTNHQVWVRRLRARGTVKPCEL